MKEFETITRYFKPQLNDIKGGGAFSDNADSIMAVWKPDSLDNSKKIQICRIIKTK